MVRKVFFCFHYKPDNWRVSQIRSIGAIERNKSVSDNDWETISTSDAAIERWIAGQLVGRSCTVILAGNGTANRKWVNHEISKSWNAGMGVVCIHIHGLKNSDGYICNKGANPLDHVTFNSTGKKLSSVAKCYNPAGANSRERYAWISRNLSAAIEEAISIRNAHS